MNSDRFDAVAKTLARRGARRHLLGGLLGVTVANVLQGRASAQVETVASDNGGSTNGADDTGGSVVVDGGEATNSTSIHGATEGGASVAGANGGSENLAYVDETCPNVGACTGTRNDCAPPEDECGCWPTPEGGSLCGQNFFCILGPPCVTSADCAEGEACVATCCDELACALPCGQFRPTDVGATGANGRTALGR
jgi:hypothetical protein